MTKHIAFNLAPVFPLKIHDALIKQFLTRNSVTGKINQNKSVTFITDNIYQSVTLARCTNKHHFLPSIQFLFYLGIYC